HAVGGVSSRQREDREAALVDELIDLGPRHGPHGGLRGPASGGREGRPRLRGARARGGGHAGVALGAVALDARLAEAGVLGVVGEPGGGECHGALMVARVDPTSGFPGVLAPQATPCKPAGYPRTHTSMVKLTVASGPAGAWPPAKSALSRIRQSVPAGRSASRTPPVELSIAAAGWNVRRPYPAQSCSKSPVIHASMRCEEFHVTRAWTGEGAPKVGCANCWRGTTSVCVCVPAGARPA